MRRTVSILIVIALLLLSCPIALAAPRAIAVHSATEDLWADPKGEFLSAYHAGKVFELYSQSGMKITAHGLKHSSADSLSDDELIEEFSNDKENLKRAFNVAFVALRMYTGRLRIAQYSIE